MFVCLNVIPVPFLLFTTHYPNIYGILEESFGPKLLKTHTPTRVFSILNLSFQCLHSGECNYIDNNSRV